MNTTLLGGITFLLAFAGIIFVHELGHYLVARLCRIDVEEFGFGFPPRMLKLFRWKGTDFTLNWIPLGGFVRLKGEDNPDLAGGMASANPWKRIAVLVAGAAMNLLAAVVVYLILFIQLGKVPDPQTAVISTVTEDTPAAAAGLQPGDIVLAAGGVHITGFEQLSRVTHASAGEEIELVVLRGDETLTLSIVPRTEYPSNQGPMGVGIGMPLTPPESWTQYIGASLSAVGNDINSLLSLPGKIIAGTISPQEAQIGGPRSIWNLFQQSVSRDISSRQPTDGQAASPTNYTLLIIISLTTTVAVANLLPIPALDGGRVFMALIEIVSRKRIPAKYQMAINGASFMILLVVLGFFYIKDIISPVSIVLP
jgi:regulator of sigma E protease